MALHREVLAYLRPNGGYVSVGENYDGITFEANCEPFTKAEYENAFNLVDMAKAQQAAEGEAKKQALLDRLGITAEEARLLLS